MEPMHRRLSRSIAYVVVLAVLALLAIEAAVRITGMAPPLPKLYRDSVFIPHPILPYHLAPSVEKTVPAGSGEFTQHMQHNAAGFRDVEHALAKPENTLRILGVGDSFTYGAGVDYADTYLAVLEQSMNDAPSATHTVEIIKVGIGGFGTHAQRLLVEHEGVAYEPDLILVGFNETDIFEAHLGIEATRVYPGFLKNAQAKRLGYTRTWLILHSHAARLIHRHLGVDSIRETWRAFGRDEGAKRAAWETVAEELGLIRAAAAEAGAAMAVCYIPMKLDDDDRTRTDLLRACEAQGIPVIDTTKALKAARGDGALYWKKDGHCTARGYRAIAEALYGALGKPEGLLYR